MSIAPPSRRPADTAPLPGQSERLDHYLIRHGLASSRRTASDLIASGSVRVNGRRLHKGEAIRPDDRVEIAQAPTPPTIVPNPHLEISVLYEDAALLVVNKPGLMPCHPLKAGERDTLINALAAAFPETAIQRGKPLEGGLIHRLDNGTSGAVMVARTGEALATLRTALRSGTIKREYWALVTGRLDKPVEITTPVAHDRNPRKMVAAGRGDRLCRSPRPAATIVIPLKRHHDFTLVRVFPHTGRRHQIRVHLASIGHPIAGDALYGGRAIQGLREGRFWLHLLALDVDSPVNGRIHVEAPLAPDLQRALEALR